jgi:hypothetical protein
MPSYTYIVSNGKTASLLYFWNIEASESPSLMPTPQPDQEPIGTGTIIEAWTDEQNELQTDNVEDGLYSTLHSTYSTHPPH